MIQSSCSCLTASYAVQQGVFLPRDCSFVKVSSPVRDTNSEPRLPVVSYRKLKQRDKKEMGLIRRNGTEVNLYQK